MLRLLRYVSLRHLRRSRLRTLLTIAGVVVGVAVSVGIAAVNRAVIEAFRSTVDTVSGKADLDVSGGPSGFPEEALEKVRSVKGVFKAAGAVSQVVRQPGEHGDSLYVLGVDLGDDGWFREYRSAGANGPDLGDPLAFLNEPDALLLSARLAKEKGLKVGDKLPLVTTNGARDFTIRGLLAEDGPVKAFGGAFAVMDIFAAQAAFDRDRKLDRIDVAVAKGADIDAVKAQLSQALGDAFSVERPQRRGQSVENMLRAFQLGLNLGSAVALLVGIFLVYNTVSISVVQRRKEIGTLRALGTSGGQIRALFALEAGVLGVLGTIPGIPFGALVAKAALSGATDTISSLYVSVRAGDVAIQSTDILVGVLLGVGGSVVAALWPASQAARVQPVEALRKDPALARSSPGQRRLTLGIAALSLLLAWPVTHLPVLGDGLPVGGFASIFFVLFGVTLLSPFLLAESRRLFGPLAQALFGINGRLAAENFSRAPGRTAVPVSALTVGVSMTVAIGGYVGSFQKAAERWVDQSVPADIFVTASYQFAGNRNTPMAPALGEEISKLPGVAHVDRVRIVHVDFRGLNVMLLSLDPAIYFERAHPDFREGDAATARRLLDTDGVLISENLAERRNLHPGDVLEIPTPSGLKRYPVGGVVTDYTSDQGLIAIDRRNFVRDFRDERVDTFELYLAPGVDSAPLRREILERWGKKFDLFALSNQQLRAEMKKLISDAFSLTYAMEVVAVALALLGVMNTLLAAVLDRTRELGLLRAVGATRGQVVGSISCEALLMGVSGGALGIGTGLVLAQIIIGAIASHTTGWSFPLSAPWDIAGQMAVACCLTAVVAGLYPAWRAAKLDVVEALAWE